MIGSGIGEMVVLLEQNRHLDEPVMSVLLEQNYQFPDTGIYHMTIQHGMRDSVLRGITDIGLEIRRNGKE